MSEAIARGISRYMLYSLRDRGLIIQISRGVYRLADLPPISDPDLLTIALRSPDAVICLISSLSFHDLTTQVPHEVSVAIPRNSRPPSLEFPPIDVHRFSNNSYRAGIQEHQIDGVAVKIYSPEKTLADCFKFRNRIGMDIVIEALTLYKRRMDSDYNKILEYAGICRVERIIRPYLEAMI